MFPGTNLEIIRSQPWEFKWFHVSLALISLTWTCAHPLIIPAARSVGHARLKANYKSWPPSLLCTTPGGSVHIPLRNGCWRTGQHSSSTVAVLRVGNRTPSLMNCRSNHQEKSKILPINIFLIPEQSPPPNSPLNTTPPWFVNPKTRKIICIHDFQLPNPSPSSAHNGEVSPTR